jgi:lipid II:glycine glycyltransferase (peptidoglycan interpeptide bridge formation enzyme)
MNNVKFTTLFNDLTLDEAFLWKGIKKNTKYEINRAKNKDNLICSEFLGDKAFFIDFYNKFSIQKGLDQINANSLDCFEDNLIITQVRKEEEKHVLVMHCYFTDDNSRARLLYSASHKDVDDNNLVGRANRLLHWNDILALKSKLYEILDWGGCRVDENGKAETGIGKFKQDFGGKIVREDTLISWPLWCMSKLKTLL